MKSLYDENDYYTPEAIEIENELMKAIAPFFQKWTDRGFSPREISHLSVGVASLLECETILNNRSRK